MGLLPVTPPSHAHLVYVDKDSPRIARYEIADEPEFNGKRYVLTHAVESDLGSEPIREIDWEVVEAFRINPPDEFAVPATTTPAGK